MWQSSSVHTLLVTVCTAIRWYKLKVRSHCHCLLVASRFVICRKFISAHIVSLLYIEITCFYFSALKHCQCECTFNDFAPSYTSIEVSEGGRTAHVSSRSPVGFHRERKGLGRPVTSTFGHPCGCLENGSEDLKSHRHPECPGRTVGKAIQGNDHIHDKYLIILIFIIQHFKWQLAIGHVSFRKDQYLTCLSRWTEGGLLLLLRSSAGGLEFDTFGLCFLLLKRLMKKSLEDVLAMDDLVCWGVVDSSQAWPWTEEALKTFVTQMIWSTYKYYEVWMLTLTLTLTKKGNTIPNLWSQYLSN